jgi:hypothetical protein
MNTKLTVTGIILILVAGIALFHKNLFPIRKMDVRGNQLISSEKFLEFLPRGESLISLDKEALANRIKKLEFVDGVRLSIKLFDTLIIEVKEKKIVGQIIYKKKKYYLSAKAEILPEKSYLSKEIFPEFKIEKKVDKQRLILLSRHLSMMNFYDKNFFKKIEEISLDALENTDIFIRNGQDGRRHYILNSEPELEDFLRIRFLENQNPDYQVLDLRGNYLIVRR